MSLRFRQRFKLLPGIYLNIGLNGVSTTIGPRGANINIGKNGIYLNTGIPGTGISNRQNLLGGKENTNHNPLIDTNSIPLSNDAGNIDDTQQIITSEGLIGLKEHLEESRNQRQSLASEIKDIENTLCELQSDLSKKQKGFFSLFTKKETLENLQNDVNETIESITDLKKEYEESKADINIQFDAEIQEQYKSLIASCNELIQSYKIWNITSQTNNTQLKSAATTVVERKEVHFKWCTIDFIKSDYNAFQLENANGSDLFIFPAFILVLNKQVEITLIDLKDLNFSFNKQRFNEQITTLPIDSKTVDYTWYKVNKDGSRDLRFAGNYQIPVVNYGALNFTSLNGLKEIYYISNVDFAENFANDFDKYLRLLKGEHGLKSHNLNPLQMGALESSKLDNIIDEFLKIPSSPLPPFTIQYYNLILGFSDELASIAKKLIADETLFQKLDITLGQTSANTITTSCILYDLCQIAKMLCKEKLTEGSLAMSGLVLLSDKLLNDGSLIATGLQLIERSRSLETFNSAEKNIIIMADKPNPILIKIKSKGPDEDIPGKDIQKTLSLPLALKVINHPLFDEYATTLYHFANIIAKADNTVSKKEEETLKNIYQITHNPLPSAENKSLNISEMNEKESLDEVLNELEALIGLDAVKAEVKSLINYIKIQKEREKVGLKSSQVSYHCVFTGSPGTGKTTIARLVAKIYMHLGILQKGHLVETDRSGLVAEYLGQTAVKVNKIVDSAIDGVLFIDEAYSLVGENNDDFGKEAVATLIKRMEDDRDKLIVILAGYTQEMKTFIDINPGLKSRFNRYIEFADYSPSELEAIFKLNCIKLDYNLTDDANKKLLEIVTTAFTNRDRSFGNGRFVRNIFEKTLEKQANRISSIAPITKEILSLITADDITNE